MATLPLNDRIQHFYDRSTQLWLDTWGEHMHHGYFGLDGKTKKDPKQAQIDLIETFLDWGGVTQASKILDAGCGIGGSSRHLAKKFQADVLGLTLSPVQAQAAANWSQQAGLDHQVKVIVQDMMELDAMKHAFDLIWSMESAEHIPDKKRMLQSFHQLLEPGGKLLMATWCSKKDEAELTPKERQLLQKIYELYHLPPMISIGTYQQLAAAAGFKDIRTADWSDAVAPFWPAVIRSAFRWQSIKGLVRAGRPAIMGAWAMQYMVRGYKTGLIQFGLLQAKKI